MSLIARFSIIAAIALSLASCGGGGGGGSSSATPVGTTKPAGGTTTTPTGTGTGTGTTTPTPTNAPIVSLTAQSGINVTPISVNTGLSGNFPNLIYVTVSVCNTTNVCVQIPNVQVDTGSVGLRVLDSFVQTLNLAPVNNTGGSAVGECAQFADGASWGAVRYANVSVGGLTTTSAIPIQVIDDGATAADVADQAATPEPAACTGDGTAENTAATLGANGIIGVGYFQQDCGGYCGTTLNNGVYFGCVTNSCSNTLLATNLQVSNPISSFPANYNNGNIIELPSVPAGGAMVANGYLVFGVGTTANNALPTATPIGVDNYGDVNANFNGANLNESFIDSGSSVYFFADTTNPIPSCSDGFYCPTTNFNGSVTLTSNTPATPPAGSLTFSFVIANADALFASTTSANAYAFDNLGANSTSVNVPTTTSFDVGEPFFYGKSVFTVIEGSTAGAYTGPFAAIGTAS